MHATRLQILLTLTSCLTVACGSSSGQPDSGLGQDGGDNPPECQRRVLEEEVPNSRDLGGHPLLAGDYVACQKIFRGGDLKDLSRAGCGEFAEMDIRTVVDLRMESYQQTYPAPQCVSTQASVLAAPLIKLDPSAENYVALLQETDSIAAVFAALGEAQGYPVYIHCRIGRDRASTVSALVLLALGAERQTVIDEFKLNNEAGVAVKQEYIEALLDEIDRLGGIQAYLDSIGVNTGQLRALKEQATF